MSLQDEYARFIASGYTEDRWQLVLKHRSDWRLKQQALRDWSTQQEQLPKPTSGTSTVIKDFNTRLSVLEKMAEEKPPDTIKTSGRI